MATSNFHSNITPIRYIIPDNNETLVQDTILNIEASLEAKIGDDNIFINDSITVSDELRSYPSKSICSVFQGFEVKCDLKFDDGTLFDAYQIEYSFIIVLRTGYYNGFNIDVSDEVYTLEGNGEDIHYQSDSELLEASSSLGINKKLMENIIKEWESLRETALNVIDNYTKGVEIIATFSNGENVIREID